MSEAPLLSVDELTVGYRGQPDALTAVSLHLDESVHLALTGPSGAGKSTLARVVLGLQKPTAGAVRVVGREVGQGRQSWLRRSVQMLPQDAAGSLDPRRDVATSLAEPVRCLLPRTERSGSALAARTREALDIVGLPRAAAERRPHELSGGQRRRAALARALMVRPRLLVADEPTVGLDPVGRLDLASALAGALAAQRTTLLLVTHDLPVAGRLCQRSVRLEHGRVVP